MGNFKNSYYFHKELDDDHETLRIVLSEEVSFLNKASIRETLDKLPKNSKVIIDATNSKYIDFDVLEIIKEFTEIKSKLKILNVNVLD